jgi:hypothetical protein
MELTPEEASVLRSVLDDYLSDLRMEIADTDGMDFREQLKEKSKVLRRLIDRLAAEFP